MGAADRPPHLLPDPAMSRRVARLALVACLAASLAACASHGSGDAVFRPWVGQAGKDVMWVPTLDTLVMPMLEVARVTKDDLVIDLGSGDGKLPIAAAQRFGARAVGIEYDEKLAALAQRNAERAGVTDRVRLIRGDIFNEDFSQATVLTLFLGQELNAKLRPTILAMRPGTRVVSNSFDMGTWEPDRTIRLPDQNPVFYWVVPARAEGEWEVDGLADAPKASLRLAQTFQKVEGTLVAAGRPPVPVRGRLDGNRLALEIGEPSGTVRRIDADIAGGGWTGRASGGTAAITGRRVR